MRELGVFLVFASALLYLAVERQSSVPALLFVAGLMGLLVGVLAPRKKLLLGLVPALGGFLIHLVVVYPQEIQGLTVLLNLWVPLALASLVGAFLGSRLRLFPRRGGQ